jgi:hypothetical protein
MKDTDPLPKPTPAAFDLDNIAAVEATVVYLIQSRCPDNKSQKKSIAILDDAIKCSTSPMMYHARDVLWDISGGFEELSDIASEKSADAPTYNETIKWYNRSKFFDMLATWASASLELTEKALDEQQSSTATPPVDYVKDAEDDSDPYIKPTIKTTPLYGPRPPNKEPEPYSLEWARAKLASDLRSGGFSTKQIDGALRTFDLEANDFLAGSVSACDVLERFGDIHADLSFTYEGEADMPNFYDACVMISDDLRAEITSNTLSAKTNYTTSSPEPTPRNEVCHSSEPEDAGLMWEVCGDPHRALFYTKMHAEHWAREMFPAENVGKRYARVQYRTILKFPS